MTDRLPLVSVVLPVYKTEERHLTAAIESILSQTMDRLELIIVEAEPTAGTLAVAARIGDARVRWYQMEGRASVALQHNDAVSRSRAPLVARADADDICEPERLERQLDFLRTNPAVDVIGSNLTIIDDAGNVIGSRAYPTEHTAIVRRMKRFNPVANSTVVFKRTLVDRVGGWRTTTSLPGQDYEWYSRLAHAGASFHNLPERLVRYRIHDGSLKSTKLRATIRSTLETKERYWLQNFGIVDRSVYWLEHALLLLPPSLVFRAFVAARYRKERQVTDVSEVRARSTRVPGDRRDR